MAAPIIPLQVVQVAVEATRGTGIATTHALDFTPGTAMLTRNRPVIRIRNAGSLATSHRSYMGRDWAALDYESTVTYDWLPWVFNHFLGPQATGTGAGANKTWTFDGTVVSDTTDNLKSSTWEVGGKDSWPSEYQIAGVVGDKLTITIKQDDAWRLKAAFLGQKVTPQAKTAAINPVSALTDVLGTGTKVYIDTTSAFGTTQVVGTVISGEITIDLGMAARFTLDGVASPQRMALTGPRTISCKLVIEYGAQTFYTNWQAATAQRVRLVATGPTLGAANYSAQVDIPGTWETWVLGNDSGVVTQEMVLTAQYDSTPAADINAVVVNASGTLP